MADEQTPGQAAGGHAGRATVGQVRAKVRRILRRHPEHDETSLNIYPMMDMMTILLVFLIMQFAQGGSEIVQSDALQIPYSTSEVEPTEAIVVQISATQISVDGQHVINLRNGQVDPSDKRGGGTGFLITKLSQTMETHRDRLKRIAQMNASRPFKGAVRIIADRRTPFRTLSEVIYTLGQAEFAQLHFVLLKRERS